MYETWNFEKFDSTLYWKASYCIDLFCTGLTLENFNVEENFVSFLKPIFGMKLYLYFL